MWALCSSAATLVHPPKTSVRWYKCIKFAEIKAPAEIHLDFFSIFFYSWFFFFFVMLCINYCLDFFSLNLINIYGGKKTIICQFALSSSPKMHLEVA